MLVGYLGEIAKTRTVNYYFIVVVRLTHTPAYFGTITFQQDTSSGQQYSVSPILSESIARVHRRVRGSAGTSALYDMFSGKASRPVLYSMADARMRKWKPVELFDDANVYSKLDPPKFTMPFLDVSPTSGIDGNRLNTFCSAMNVYRHFETPANLCAALMLANEVAMRKDDVPKMTAEEAKQALLGLGSKKKEQVELDL